MARFIPESDKSYPKDLLHMYAENKPVMTRNEVVLNDLPSSLYTIEANDKITDNSDYPLALILNKKQTNTGSLIRFLNLKIGTKVISNKCQINSQKRNILRTFNLLKVVFVGYM